jgi:hypothetical protein
MNSYEPSKGSQAEPLALPARAGVVRRLWAGWVRLIGPHPTLFSTSMSDQERLRRSRLVSALLLLICAAIGLLLPSLSVQPLIWRPVLLLAGGRVLVTLINRWGAVTFSGLAYVAMVDVALAGYIWTKPIFTYGNVPNLDLFILPLLIGGVVLPRRWIAPLALLHIALILSLFTYKPHDDLLTSGIQRYFAGQSYTAYINALLLQVCGAGIAWLQAWSMERALLRASRAEELTQAQARIEEQARLLAEQKGRLEQSVTLLQGVQQRIANGDLSARVPLSENDLLPLAVTFNVLAERLNREHQAAQAHRRLEEAIRYLLEAASGPGGAGFSPTGTLADRLAPLVLERRQASERLRTGGMQAEDLAALLQRQYEQLQQVQAVLRRAQALDSPEQARLLLEEANSMTTQASTLGLRCARGAHVLGKRLSEVR